MADARVKVLCSQGSRIVRDPEGRSFSYLPCNGGMTKMVELDRGVTYSDFICRVCSLFPLVVPKGLVLKYNMPGLDFSDLISVSNRRDFEVMKDVMLQAYDDILRGSLPKLPPPFRLFLDLPPVFLPRVEILCSYAGKILLHPLERKIVYDGGITKIIELDHNTTYPEFISCLCERFSLPVQNGLVVKYQMPKFMLTDLVSLANNADFKLMKQMMQQLTTAALSKTLLHGFRLYVDPPELEIAQDLLPFYFN